MIKDRETVKRVLSVIALSVALGFNAEYAVSQTSSIQICQSIEDEKKKRDFAILTRGNVSRKSIQSARRLLNEMLSDKVRESMVGGDYLTLVEDKEFQRYWRSDYKRGSSFTGRVDATCRFKKIKFTFLVILKTLISNDKVFFTL